MISKFIILRMFILSALIIASQTGCSGKLLTPFSTWVNLDFRISSDINPNALGRPSPVVVRVYELRTPDLFKSLEFFDILDREKEALEISFISKQELEFQPGVEFSLEKKLSPDTKYIGVIAAFRDWENSDWRDIVPVKKSRTNRLHIKIQGNSILFGKNN